MNKDRNQKTDDRKQKSEDRSQMTDFQKMVKGSIGEDVKSFIHLFTASPLHQIKVCVLFSVFCLLSFVLLSPSVSKSEDLIEVKGLRHWATAEYIRVVIDLSGPAEFSKGKLSNPERLFFDIKNAKLLKGIQTNFAIGAKPVKAVRLGQFTPDIVRIVFDLETPDYDFKVFSLEDPARLVVELSSKVGIEDKKDIKTEAKVEDKQDKTEGRNIGNNFISRKIVIDPGHGGHDPGAVGPGGLFEKDVVLDIALKVRDIIKNEYPFYDVVLTRDKDIFIPLKDRAKIANDIDADLFLSIHANASPNRYARGIETYFLNWTDDEEALRVAARENAISVKKMKQVQSELGLILASLERDRKRDDSIKLAGSVHASMVANIRPQFPKTNDLGIKSALFYVLVDAEMASALAEVSFISNPEEERLLSDDSYRQQLAYSLVKGINAYFDSSPPQHKVVYRISHSEAKPHASNNKKSPDRKLSNGKKNKSKRVKYVRR
ncbi:N-acetylmuramoyl-L-alanine amidase [hot springs metagenome]|uniref:N-acetylmuramoyl-L-alanine amidase n=1 Tax=hot springs metagenome TaxID=433727 RepID=A0A5J4L284_9ZZZZ